MTYDIAGHGEPTMLFVHGWCCDRTFFAPQFDYFAATHRVVAVDLPGHGGTPALADCTIEALAAEVAGLVGGLGVGPVVAVGHSLGAIVALAMTAQGAEPVTAVVMIDPPPLDTDVWKGLAAKLIPSTDGPDGTGARRRFVEQMFLPTDDASRRDRIISVMCAVPDEVATPLVTAMATFDAEQRLRTCKVPVLVIGSAVPANSPTYLRKLNPAITIGQTVGAGHFNQLEVPGQVNLMIERGLSLMTLRSSDDVCRG